MRRGKFGLHFWSVGPMSLKLHLESVVSRSRSLLLKVENSSDITMELSIQEAYEERNVRTAFRVSWVKVKVTVTKKEKKWFWSITSVRIEI